MNFSEYSLDFIQLNHYFEFMWNIIRTDLIAEWISQLDDDAKEAILKNLIILSEIGPTLGRPHVDTINQSRHKNMKELRVQNKRRIYRIFFIFDPERNALLLIGGDKRGDKKFYEKMIPLADKLYDEYILKMEKKNEKNK